MGEVETNLDRNLEAVPAPDFRAIFEASMTPTLVLAPDAPRYTIVAVNQAYLEATMTAREAIVGRAMFDVFPDNPEAPDATGAANLHASLDRVLARRGTDEMALQQYDIRRPDGTFEERHWRPTNIPMLGTGGEVQAILHCVEDVTPMIRLREAGEAEHRRAEYLRTTSRGFEAEVRARTRELASQKAFAESIIQNVPAGVAYLDRDLVYRVANPMYSEFLRLTPEEIVGRYLFDVVPGGEAQIEPLLRGVLETGRPHYASNFSFVYVDANGRPRQTYWDFVYYPAVLGPGTEVDGVLVLANEISERVEKDHERERLQRERIEALEQTDRLKDQFLGILSHELRTPLNAIQGFGSILEDGVAGELSPVQAAFAGKILTSADHLLALVDDLLDLSRVQAGKFRITPEPVDPAPVVREALATLTPEAARKAQDLREELPPDLPLVLADPQRLSQVVGNLVSNAVKYTPEGGHIAVRARPLGDRLRVEVVDDGIGVPPDQHERVFQSFTQVDMTNTREKGGVGLGLSIVKALVESHGGEVGLESQPGKGSTFWFTLPVAARRA